MSDAPPEMNIDAMTVLRRTCTYCHFVAFLKSFVCDGMISESTEKNQVHVNVWSLRLALLQRGHACGANSCVLSCTWPSCFFLVCNHVTENWVGPEDEANYDVCIYMTLCYIIRTKCPKSMLSLMRMSGITPKKGTVIIECIFDVVSYHTTMYIYSSASSHNEKVQKELLNQVSSLPDNKYDVDVIKGELCACLCWSIVASIATCWLVG